MAQNQPTGYFDPQTGAFVPFAKKKKKKWPWIVAAIVLVIAIGAGAGNKSKPAENEKAAPETEAAEPEAKSTEIVPIETEAPETDATMQAPEAPAVNPEPEAKPEPEPKPELLTEDAFLENVRTVVPNGMGSGEKVTSVTLKDRVLTVSVDLSGSTAPSPANFTIEMLAESRASQITEQILTLPWDFWDTVVVDFGDAGKSTNEKQRIITTEYGSYFENCALDAAPSAEKPTEQSGLLDLLADLFSGDSETKEDPEFVAETVLLNDYGVKITAKGTERANLFGPGLKLLIENNSGKNLVVQARNVSVNGYMTDVMFSADVADGKKKNDSIIFQNASLSRSGIDTLAEIELSFHIFESESWDTYVDTEPVTVRTKAAETYQFSFDDSGKPLYSGNGIRIVAKDISESENVFGTSLHLYIENNTDKTVTVQSRNVSVNGFMVEPLFSSDITPGKRVVSSMVFMKSSLEENEITSIETVELSFHVFESESWDTVFDSEAITFEP